MRPHSRGNRNLKSAEGTRFTWHYIGYDSGHVSVFSVGDRNANPMNLEIIAVGCHDEKKSKKNKVVYTFVNGWQTELDRINNGKSFQFN